MHLPDIANLLPHGLSHRIARVLGVESALEIFCHECASAFWDEPVVDPPATETSQVVQ